VLKEFAEAHGVRALEREESHVGGSRGGVEKKRGGVGLTSLAEGSNPRSNFLADSFPAASGMQRGVSQRTRGKMRMAEEGKNVVAGPLEV